MGRKRVKRVKREREKERKGEREKGRKRERDREEFIYYSRFTGHTPVHPSLVT
jgi:hypothetical protein